MEIKEMENWTDELAEHYIWDYHQLTGSQKKHLISYLNKSFPFGVYLEHKALRQRAFENEEKSKSLLEGAHQFFPEIIQPSRTADPKDMSRCTVLLTAGGEGERLRLSLEALGYGTEELADFTKATFPIPGFYKNFGTLQTNLVLISSLGKRIGCDIPVIITTGPEGSATDRVIHDLVTKHNRYGLKNLLVIPQKRRLHLTRNDQIAWYLDNDIPIPVTHPDETGGPLMRLKDIVGAMGKTPLAWLSQYHVDKILVLQATALYNPEILFAMAGIENDFDCVGLGILRETFEPDDPYGSYVGIEKNGEERVMIVEQNVRNDHTLALKDASGTHHLPYNTGLYTFNRHLLEKGSLPDFATPPKEILPQLERTPKVGYAATDLISLARNPAVMAVPSDWYAVIKRAEDLKKIAELGKAFQLDRLCADEGF